MGVYGIDMGHSLSGAGTGASGLLSEVIENRKVGKRLIEMLKEKGHTVVDCSIDKASSTNEQLSGIVKRLMLKSLIYLYHFILMMGVDMVQKLMFIQLLQQLLKQKQKKLIMLLQIHVISEIGGLRKLNSLC